MSAVIDIETDASLTPDEFFAYICENIDPEDPESMIEHACSLRALANNRTFVLDAYHAELEALVLRK